MHLIRFFDVFTGIGGFRSGLEKAGGFECVGYCEMNALIRYYKNDDYRDEVKRIIRVVFVLKCDDGVLRSSYEKK